MNSLNVVFSQLHYRRQSVTAYVCHIQAATANRMEEKEMERRAAEAS
jgi:hypothetical protein